MLKVKAEAVPSSMSTGSGDAEVPMSRRLDQLSGGWDQVLDREDLRGLASTRLKWPGMPGCSTMGGISGLSVAPFETCCNKCSDLKHSARHGTQWGKGLFRKYKAFSVRVKEDVREISESKRFYSFLLCRCSWKKPYLGLCFIS